MVLNVFFVSLCRLVLEILPIAEHLLEMLKQSCLVSEYLELVRLLRDITILKDFRNILPFTILHSLSLAHS